MSIDLSGLVQQEVEESWFSSNISGRVEFQVGEPPDHDDDERNDHVDHDPDHDGGDDHHHDDVEDGK